jgi:hypothetical protein
MDRAVGLETEEAVGPRPWVRVCLIPTLSRTEKEARVRPVRRARKELTEFQVVAVKAVKAGAERNLNLDRGLKVVRVS